MDTGQTGPGFRGRRGRRGGTSKKNKIKANPWVLCKQKKKGWNPRQNAVSRFNGEVKGKRGPDEGKHGKSKDAPLSPLQI